MKHKLLSVTALFFVFIITGCSGNEEEDNLVNNEAETPQGVIEEKAPEATDDFASAVESELLALENDMNRIENIINSSSNQLKGKLDEKWAELEQIRQEIEFSLDELVNADDTSQQKLKAEIKVQLKELKKGILQVKNELGMEE